MTRTLSDRERSFELSIPELTLAPGDRRAVVGPTGSGKSTAMDLVALASAPDRCARYRILAAEGSAPIDVYGTGGTSGEGQRTSLRARFFGYVVQSSPLLPFLSVLENVTLQQRLSARLDREHALHLLDAVGLANEVHARPRDLSVGQRQRTAIARALAHRPSFLLCDEPTGALDAETAVRCLEAMVGICERLGTAILMITHDEALVRRFGFATTRVTRRPVAEGRWKAVLECDDVPPTREAA